MRDFEQDYVGGGVGVIGAAVYLWDNALPELALRNSLDQIARIYKEVDGNPRFRVCRTYNEVLEARAEGKIAFILTCRVTTSLRKRSSKQGRPTRSSAITASPRRSMTVWSRPIDA